MTELQRVQEESARSKKEKDGLQAELQKAGRVVSNRAFCVGSYSM